MPEIKVKDLSQIILEMLASLNSMQKEKDRLIEITVDGKVSGDELADFVAIQEQLEKISVAVETLQLWCERMLAQVPSIRCNTRHTGMPCGQIRVNLLCAEKKPL